MEHTKTFGNSHNADSQVDPLNVIKKESVERMKTALLATNLGDPREASTALRQVAILRVYHQVTRIIQYLDLMDKLEEKLYESIELDLVTLDTMDDRNVTRLLSIQDHLQKSIIQSNKLLESYIDMNDYPVFLEVQSENLDNNTALALPASDRDRIRDAAGRVLEELSTLELSN